MFKLFTKSTKKPIQGRYRSFYPELKRKDGTVTYKVEYLQLSQRWEIYRNGNLWQKHDHSNAVLLAILRDSTPYTGRDLDIPRQYRKTLREIEEILCLEYLYCDDPLR